MHVCDTVCSHSTTMIDRLKQDLSHMLPEERVEIVFVDKHGTYWSSRMGESSGLGADEPVLVDILARIDDGHDPLIMSLNDTCVVASQLVTSITNWGYIVVLFPKRNSDSALPSLDLAELVLDQIKLIAQMHENRFAVGC